MSKMVSIAKFTNAVNAQMIADRLQGDGIPCFLSNINMGMTLPGVIRIDLMVRHEDVMEAKRRVEDLTSGDE